MSAMTDNKNIVLKVEGLSKKFCTHLRRSMYYGTIDIFRNMIGFPAQTQKLRNNEFWALEDINFELHKGDSLGIIGVNGSGKTTLLRLLTGIFPPDKGRISIKGHIGSLIAVGAGFHPHMTGRENIYLNGTILGMSKSEIQSKFDEIVDFAEIKGFLDAPVSTYSSGMKVRLGFSIAVKIRPEILLVDEVLSVGDQKFRRKARKEMDKLLGSGVTIIFVSHNMHEVMGITQNTIWLENGKIFQEGKTNLVVSEYLKSCEDAYNIDKNFQYSLKRTGEIELQEINCYLDGVDYGREVVFNLNPNEPKLCAIKLRLIINEDINEKVFYSFILKTSHENNVGYTGFQEIIKAKKGDIINLDFAMNLDRLHSGNYIMNMEVATDGGPPLEGIKNLFYIAVNNNYKADDNKGLCLYRMVNNSAGGYFLPMEREK